MNRVWKVESNTGSVAEVVNGPTKFVVRRPLGMTLRKFSAMLFPGRFINENTLLSRLNPSRPETGAH
jgi:hypothetical protein